MRAGVTSGGGDSTVERDRHKPVADLLRMACGGGEVGIESSV